jgi:hypothetical protein
MDPRIRIRTKISWIRNTAAHNPKLKSRGCVCAWKPSSRGQMSKKYYFAILEEIYNNVVPHWSAVLISWNLSITHITYLFTKNASNQKSILTVYGPSTHNEQYGTYGTAVQCTLQWTDPSIVVDTWLFGTDPDPGIRTNDLLTYVLLTYYTGLQR